jgi:MFS family permease
MKWRALIVLSAAQFLMVLDQAVMNVSISQLVEDFDTTMATIQGVITLYALTTAALMITGGKLGDRWGRKRTFSIGLVIYGSGVRNRYGTAGRGDGIPRLAARECDPVLGRNPGSQ